MDINHKTVTKLVIEALATHVPTVEPEEINTTDHLEYDLLLDISLDTPKIVQRVEDEVGRQIDRDALDDFINEAGEDDNKGTVEELISFIKDELLYN